MKKIFLHTALHAGLLFCSSLLFCPSPTEISTALQELAAPEMQGTSEPELARALYLELDHKYSDLISDIERHVSTDTDAEHLTEYADILLTFSNEIESGLANLTLLCERVASSEKDSSSITVLINSLLDTKNRLSLMRTNITERFTASNIAIAQTLAQDESKPQQEILDECPEPRPRATGKQRMPIYRPSEFDEEAPVKDVADSDATQSPSGTDDDFDISSFMLDEEQAEEENCAVTAGALAQQLITAARPMAESSKFEVIGKACSPQGPTLNCGYHATCNGHVVAKVIQGISILNSAIEQGALAQLTPAAPVAFENIPLPSRSEIVARKTNFLLATHEVINPTSAIDGFTLAHFAEFNEALTRTPQTPIMYGSTTQPAVYFEALEYMQNKEREIITDLHELVAFFNESDANKRTLWSFLKNGFVIDEGAAGIQTLFPDQAIPIPGTSFSTDTLRNSYSFWREMEIRGGYEVFTNALTAFKGGKTLVTPWLDHSGAHAGCGHWTCKVFIPEKRNGSVQPNFVKIINIDSCDSTGNHAHIDDNVKRFVFDLLHLELPAQTDLNAIAQLFNPRNIFADSHLQEEASLLSAASGIPVH